MRTSSTRRRTAAASLAALLGLGLSFGITSPAFAGNDKPKNDNHGGGEARPWSDSGDDDSQVPDPNGNDDNRHPSGKDRHEDKGAQGHSNSDPDGDENGGADKPYEAGDGTGGLDSSDQDGNNGCGNDDDFEDDNNGNCGGPKKDNPPTTGVGGTDEEEEEEEGTKAGAEVKSDTSILGASEIAGAVVGSEIAGATGDTSTLAGNGKGNAFGVLGVQFERAADAAAASPFETEVKGVTFTRAADLARTGSSLVLIALAGLALVLFGFIIKRTGRRSSI